MGSPRLVKYASVVGVRPWAARSVGKPSASSSRTAVRAQVDAHTQGLDRSTPLEHLHRKPCTVQAERGGEAADSANAMRMSSTESADELVDLRLDVDDRLQMLACVSGRGPSG